MYQQSQQPPSWGYPAPNFPQQSTGATSLTSIIIRAITARGLKNTELIGKQDPYVTFFAEITGTHTLRTFTHKDGGEQPTWNQELRLELPPGAPELYVEVWDEDVAADDLCGFCAIPLSQVPVDAWFQLFTIDGKPKGEIRLAITPAGFAGQPPSQERAISGVNPEHQKRLHSKVRKNAAVDGGLGLLGVGLAAGAAFMGEKIFEGRKKEHEREEEERRRIQAQAQAQAHAHAHAQTQHAQGHAHLEQQHDSEKHGQHHPYVGGGVRGWDPVGVYAAGDRVEYNGRQWVCLQGFTSNPTWMPDVAPSLWRAE